MDPFRRIISVWQKAPLAWRRRIVTSPASTVARRLLNLYYPTGLQVFNLASPLEGHRMKLHWQTQKAFVFGTHEPEVTSIIGQVVKPGWTVLDVGAHIGYHTLLLAKHVGRAGKVIAFEPLPENFSVLEENVRLNGYENVVLAKRAVVDCSGPVKLIRNNNDPLTSMSTVNHERGITAEGVALDDFMTIMQGRRRVALIKMDVEGAEALALKGMARTLESDRPVILVELHGLDREGERHPALVFLAGAQYRVRYLDKPGYQTHALAEPR